MAIMGLFMPITISPIDPLWGQEGDPYLHVVLVEPEIPPNTGTIARLCAGTKTVLHLVEPLGYALDDRKLKRAGLDYWPNVVLCIHDDFRSILSIFGRERLHLFTTKATQRHTERRYRVGDALVFGPETRGLSAEIRDAHPEAQVTIPICHGHIRSLNLANAVSIGLYEALRQVNFSPLYI